MFKIQNLELSKRQLPKKEKGVVPLWLSNNPGKRWTELYFLYYSLVWMTWFGAIVITKAYESFEEWEYLTVGLLMALPCLFVPLFFPGQGEPTTPLMQRYFVKANLWIAVLSFIGNYFWTHYFYNLLGAAYTFKSHRLNNVPISMFLCTHAYFCSYHTLTTIFLRRFWTSPFYYYKPRIIQIILSCLFVAIMAYITAFMETWTISSFPYWTFKNRSLMYSVGSMCYGLYFVVSFPMYCRLDEIPGKKATLYETFIDSLGSCMIVTLLLDFWRLSIGGIVENVPQCIPFM